MKSILELCAIATPSKLRARELFADPEQSRLAEFYELVTTGQLQSEEDAEAYFLDTGMDTSGYKKLKSALKSRLINALFIIDLKQPSYSDRQKAYYECYKDAAAARILLGKNARSTGIDLLKKTLRHATHYEFTDLAMDITSTLRLHYASMEGNLKQFELYNEMYHEYETAYRHERLAEELYAEITVRQVKARAVQEEIESLAAGYYQRLVPLMDSTDTYAFHVCAMLLKLFSHSANSDQKALIGVCHDYIDYFEAKPYTANVPLQIAYYQLLVCYTQMRQYDAGERAAQRCLSFLEEGSFNWFKYREQYFLLSMHTGNYDTAFQIYQQTVQHGKFKSLPHNVQEYWQIFKAYLYYLKCADHLTVPSSQLGKFRIGKFLNNTPIFSQDKRGLNIPILIVQILVLVEQRKFDDATSCIGAVERYSTRYLRKDDTFRSNCFIKMLGKLPQANFNDKRVQLRTSELLERLEAVPLEDTKQDNGVEIIPYEHLWSMVLESTKRKGQRKSSPFAQKTRTEPTQSG